MSSLTLIAKISGDALSAAERRQALAALYKGEEASSFSPAEAPWAEFIVVDHEPEARRSLDTRILFRSPKRIAVAQIEHPSQAPKFKKTLVGEDFAKYDRRIAHVDGAFAIIEIDPSERVVRFACDKWGLERLYWRQTDNYLVVSSEARIVATFPDRAARIDPEAYARFLTWRRPDPEVTLFEGVNVAPVREWICIDLVGGGAERRRYFTFEEWVGADSEDLARTRTPRGFFEAIAEACEEMASAAGRNVLSITGGADSRIVIGALEDRNVEYDLVNFVSPFNRSRDEKLAEKLARITNRDLQRLKAEGEYFERFFDLAKEAAIISSGTFVAAGSLELYVNQAVRRLGESRFTGNYGGELFRGMREPKLPGSRSSGFSKDLLKSVYTAKKAEDSNIGDTLSREVYCNQIMPSYFYPRRTLERSQVFVVSPYLFDRVVRPFLAIPEFVVDNEYFLSGFPESRSGIASVNLDRSRVSIHKGMARVRPLVWPRVTFKLEYYCDYGMPKAVAKYASGPVLKALEERGLGRHKFVHFRRWYAEELAGQVREILLDPGFLADDFVDRRRVESIVENHISRRDNHTVEIHELIGYAAFKEAIRAA